MPTRRAARALLIALFGVIAAAFNPHAAMAAGVAEVPIRINPQNRVPACVTPQRLMAFIATRNSALDPRFRNIAAYYQSHGETWGVRWDYAFFQMVVETNYLTYMTGSGNRGDVDPRQNNFAGIGTTGGGVPGDSFPDVSSGVLGQIQHLVVYSGERVAMPVAPRTQAKQVDILQASAPVTSHRAMTFQDLSGRWAADRQYGRTIEAIAQRFRDLYCTGPELAPPILQRPPLMAARVQPPAPIQPAAQRMAAAPPVAPMPIPAQRLGAPPPPRITSCKVQTASYGGQKTLLIRAVAGQEERFTALEVIDGFERSMADGFIAAHAPGGATLAEFPNKSQALARAFELCPAGRS